MQLRPSLTDGLLIFGLLLLAAGIAAYDWRLALIVIGSLLLAGGVVGIWRGA